LYLISNLVVKTIAKNCCAHYILADQLASNLCKTTKLDTNQQRKSTTVNNKLLNSYHLLSEALGPGMEIPLFVPCKTNTFK